MSDIITSPFHEKIIQLLFSIPILKKFPSDYGRGEYILFESKDLYFVSYDKTEFKLIEKDVLDLFEYDAIHVYYKIKDPITTGFIICGINIPVNGVESYELEFTEK